MADEAKGEGEGQVGIADRLRCSLMGAATFARVALSATSLITVCTSSASTQGTAFVVAAPHIAVTAFHVVEGASEIQVTTALGAVRSAVIIAADAENDLAILRLEGAPLDVPSLHVLASDSLKKGQGVLALGYPRSTVQGREAKVTDGIISSLTGIENSPSLIQITVPIQPGSSGGPLLDRAGNVVGVVIATIDPIKMLRATGALPQNVNYAIKSEYVIRLLRDNGIAMPKRPKQKPQRIEDLITVIEPGILQVIARNAEKERQEAEKVRKAEFDRIREEAEKSAMQRIESEREQLRQLAAERRRQLESELVHLAQQDAMLASQEQSLANMISNATYLRSPLGAGGSGIVDPLGYNAYLKQLDQVDAARRQLQGISAQRAEIRSRYGEVSRSLRQLDAR